MNFKEQLLSQGYVELSAGHLADFLDIDQIEFKLNPATERVDPENTPSSNVETINHKLLVIHHEIARDYIEPYVKSYRLLHRNIWEGVILNADSWHSDAYETPDLFFLLYFNDLKDEGALCIRQGATESKIEVRSGTLVAIENNDPKFEHKVEPFVNKRTAACFRFAVEWQ